MDDLAKEITEDLDYFEPYPYSGDIIKFFNEIVDSGSMVMTLPVIGEIKVTRKDIDRVLARDNTTLENKTDELINSIDMELFNIRSKEIIEQAYIYIEDMKKSNEKIENTQKEMIDSISPLIGDLINSISLLDLKQTKDITDLVTNLKESLNLDVDIEISAPDISQDDIFAKVISDCQDSSRNIQDLRNLALNLGYSSDSVSIMNGANICTMLMKHFEY